MENSSNAFQVILHKASTLPLVKIQREDFLRKELQQHCTVEQIETAIDYSPAHAGIPESVIDELASKHINLETAKVSSISFVSGLPGGVAMAATIPADVAQYYGHILRIVQKLAYLYGWHDLAEFDETTQSMMTLFIGIMFGVNSATKVITKVSNMAAASTAKRIAAQSLTKGTLYPIVKKVALTLGMKMTKQTFARGVSKFVPVLGGVISGGITLATFKPMSLRLKKELQTFKQARADFFTATFEESHLEVEMVGFEDE